MPSLRLVPNLAKLVGGKSNFGIGGGGGGGGGGGDDGGIDAGASAVDGCGELVNVGVGDDDDDGSFIARGRSQLSVFVLQLRCTR